MKKDKRLVFLTICLLGIMLSSIYHVGHSNTSDDTLVASSLTDVEKLYNDLSSKTYIDFSSKWYKITDSYISKIYPNTKIKDFKKKFDIDLKVYSNEEEVTSGIIKTGMHVVVNEKNYKLVVIGDLNSDGVLNQIDLNRLLINVDKSDLTEIEKVTSDINEDGLIDKKDVEQLAEFLLNDNINYADVINVEKPLLEVSNGTLKTNGWYDESVTFKVSSGGVNTSKLMYEIEGTYNTEKTEIKSEDVITLNKYGAYRVNLYAYAIDGNTYKLGSIVVGVDTDNKCLKYGYDTLSDCMLLNDGDYTTVGGAISGINAKKVYIYSTSTETMDKGLISTKDDLGETYIYRGNVNDNYVVFAGSYWRIIRRNGDGSVRLMYNNTIGTSQFNVKDNDMAFVGYKYGLNQSFKVTENVLSFTNISSSANYIFSDSIDCSNDTKLCTLTGNKISGKWSEKYQEVLNGNASNGYIPYKYTCWFTNASVGCGIASEIMSYGGTTQANVKYHGYLSSVYADTYADTVDSTTKTKIDSWYETNILNYKDKTGNSYSNYLSDQIFCVDRTIASGDGETLEAHTWYGAYGRLDVYYGSSPTLMCARKDDRFTVSNAIGNKKLKYPVGLITADEVSFAGAGTGVTNSSYWLNKGVTYWTMTPYIFDTKKLSSMVMLVGSAGHLGSMSSTSNRDLFPVVNLSKDIIVTSGDGTVSNPYRVTLQR